jgi:DNA-binding GntR family transcriptional regulator
MKPTVVKKSATLREQVFQAIVNEVKSGHFSPGERITEEGLAKRLGVSRTPIREALGQLTKQGVLRARPGAGYVVPAPTVDEIRQIIAVRTLLEPAAVRMAAKEYGPAEIEKITRAIEAESSSATRTQPGQFAKANEDFRHAIFDRISNKVLSSLIAQFASHLHFIRGVTLPDRTLRQAIVERQRIIRDAVQGRDCDLAEGLWRSYLRFTEESLVGAMSSVEARTAPSSVEARMAPSGVEPRTAPRTRTAPRRRSKADVA